MFRRIKKVFYFPIASYFAFWARIRLKAWKPYIVLVTGSSGKTILLHLIESQIGKRAHYSHHANSSFGVPFDILGLKRKALLRREWFMLFLRAPLYAFKKPYKQRLYVVEADCDRQGEGKFLSSLLQPHTSIWLHSGSSHGGNFDHLVKKGRFNSSQEAIAHEFNHFIKKTRDLIIINSHNSYIAPHAKTLIATAKSVFDLADEAKPAIQVKSDSVVFQTKKKSYSLRGFFPEEIFYSMRAVQELCRELNLTFDSAFKEFKLPPGRGSIFKGIQGTTIIDSSYNSSPESVAALLKLYDIYPSEEKWIILGDMLELGNQEEAHHRALADLINETKHEVLILVGPRLQKFTLPHIANKKKTVSFIEPKDALTHIKEKLAKGSNTRPTLFFKGARFLEGIIERILENPKDIQKLCRREQVWQRRRKEWGL